MVRMRHPKLPETQTIDVMEQQVPAFQRSGWDVIPDPPEEPPGEQDSPPDNPTTSDEAPADAGASALPDTGKPPSGRRTPKEGDE